MTILPTLLAALLIATDPVKDELTFDLGVGALAPSAQSSDHARAARLPTRLDIEIAGAVARVSVTSSLSFPISGRIGAARAGEPVGSRMLPMATGSDWYQLIGVLVTALIIGLIGIWRLATRQ